MICSQPLRAGFLALQGGFYNDKASYLSRSTTGFPKHATLESILGGEFRKLSLLILASAFLVFAELGAFGQATNNVILTWDPSIATNLVGYKIYYGVASATYTNKVLVGNVTNATISDLVSGITYYFAATAYDTHSVESLFSNEISYAVPSASNIVINLNPPSVTLTSPTDGATYTLPATVAFTAKVITNSHRITQVRFYNGSALLGSAGLPPYLFAWTNVSPGSYKVAASVVYDSRSVVASAPVNLSVIALPAPWQSMDIGNVGLAGWASVSSNSCTVTGAGNLSGLADNFRFLYQPGGNSSTIQAQIKSVQSTGPNDCLGVMIRESLTPGSEYALMGMAPDGTFRFQSRASTGNLIASTVGNSAMAPNAWVLLMRSGNGFYGFSSVDGLNWTFLDSATFAMAANAYAGLAVASGGTNVLNTSVFTGLSVQP